MAKFDALVSVVVPVYNVEKYLDKCLLSLRKQTYPNIEIIVVDDKSEDTSLLIAQKHAKEDSRIRIFCHETNKKLGAARNSGIQNASGKYIMFLDSDDQYPLDAVYNMTEEIETHSSDMVIGRMGWLKGELIVPIQYIDSFLDTALLYKNYNVRALAASRWFLGSACNRIYRAAWLKNNRLYFDEGVSWEDMKFSACVWYKAQTITCCDKLVYLRTERDDPDNPSITQTYNMKKYLDRDYLEKSLFDYFMKECMTNPALKADLKIILNRVFRTTEDILALRNNDISQWLTEWYNGYKIRHAAYLSRLS